jgi:hypothetical protein
MAPVRSRRGFGGAWVWGAGRLYPSDDWVGSVTVMAPLLDDEFGFLEAVEDFAVKKLVAHVSCLGGLGHVYRPEYQCRRRLVTGHAAAGDSDDIRRCRRGRYSPGTWRGAGLVRFGDRRQARAYLSRVPQFFQSPSVRSRAKPSGALVQSDFWRRFCVRKGVPPPGAQSAWRSLSDTR